MQPAHLSAEHSRANQQRSDQANWAVPVAAAGLKAQLQSAQWPTHPALKTRRSLLKPGTSSCISGSTCRQMNRQKSSGMAASPCTTPAVPKCCSAKPALQAGTTRQLGRQVRSQAGAPSSSPEMLCVFERRRCGFPVLAPGRMAGTQMAASLQSAAHSGRLVGLACSRPNACRCTGASKYFKGDPTG